jgi:hypothetical protein
VAFLDMTKTPPVQADDVLRRSASCRLEDIADEIVQRCAVDGFDVPPRLEDFVDRHSTGRPVQLPLPFRVAA